MTLKGWTPWFCCLLLIFGLAKAGQFGLVSSLHMDKMAQRTQM